MKAKTRQFLRAKEAQREGEERAQWWRRWYDAPLRSARSPAKSERRRAVREQNRILDHTGRPIGSGGVLTHIQINAMKGRTTVAAEVLTMNAKTGIFRLPDGNIVKRKRGRDF